MEVELVAYSQPVKKDGDKNPLSIAELAASVCYDSEPTETYRIAKGCKATSHTSVLEHISFTFHVEGVSRALLAQLSRHRHISLSVQSQRYVDMNDFGYVNPFDEQHGGDVFNDMMANIANDYKLLKNLGAANEDARAVLPNACCTEFYVTINARSLIEMSHLRLCCYDRETEVLTIDGWKSFKDITDDDIYYSMNPETQECDYVKAKEIICYPYDGEMYSVNAQSIDLLITPNHNVLYSNSYDNKNWKLSQIQNIVNNKRILMKKNCKPIEGIKDSLIQTPSCVAYRSNQTGEYASIVNGIEFETDDLFRLIGFFLSDGYTTHAGYHRIIGFSKGDKNLLLEYQAILDKYNLRTTRIFDDRSSYKLEIENQALFEFFREFGDCYTKRIPSFVWRYDSTHLNHLFKGLLDGDFNKKGTAIYTVSKNMADDIQRLMLHLGLSASVKISDRRGETSSGIDASGAPYSITSKSVCYIVTVNRSKNEPIIKSYTHNAISKTEYHGMVYCVDLEKNHTLYVRRNGKAVWSGNCRAQSEIRSMFTMMKEQVATVCPELAAWMVPSCEANPKYPFCPEGSRCCGRHPKLADVYKPIEK